MSLLSRRPSLWILFAVVALAASACARTADRAQVDVGGSDGLDLTVFVDQLEMARHNRASSREAHGEVSFALPDELAYVDQADDQPDVETVPGYGFNDGDGLVGEDSQPDEPSAVAGLVETDVSGEDGDPKLGESTVAAEVDGTDEVDQADHAEAFDDAEEVDYASYPAQPAE